MKDMTPSELQDFPAPSDCRADVTVTALRDGGTVAAGQSALQFHLPE
jgi:hypothetical protein